MLGAGPGTYVPPTAMGMAKHLDELHRCVMTSLAGSAEISEIFTSCFCVAKV